MAFWLGIHSANKSIMWKVSKCLVTVKLKIKITTDQQFQISDARESKQWTPPNQNNAIRRISFANTAATGPCYRVHHYGMYGMMYIEQILKTWGSPVEIITTCMAPCSNDNKINRLHGSQLLQWPHPLSPFDATVSKMMCKRSYHKKNIFQSPFFLGRRKPSTADDSEIQWWCGKDNIFVHHFVQVFHGKV